MTNGEKIIYEGSPPLRSFLLSRNIFYLLLFGWNFGLIFSWIKRLRWHIRISDQRLVLEKGILSRSQEEVEFYHINNSEYNQCLKERLFNVGEITLHTDDTSDSKITFPIHNPEGFREKIRRNVRKERKQMTTKITANSKEERIKKSINYWHKTTRKFAVNCIQEGHGGQYSITQIADVWDKIYNSWVYVNDPHDPKEGGFAFTPANVTIDMGLRGDCDDFSTLMAASIEAIGGTARVVGVRQDDNGAHAFAEVLIANDIDSCSGSFNYLRNRYNVGKIHYNKDPKGIWLNLDWQDNHLGGKYYEGERVDIYYPLDEPPGS